jgi:hypothetical protein
MAEPFPDHIEVPQGLVQPRLPLGIPPLILLLLAALSVIPLALLGTGWHLLVTIPVGLYVAVLAWDDPDFWLAWIGEIQFADDYE